MLRKVSCLLILFSFLLVKTGPLYAIAFNHMNITLTADQQDKEIPEEDGKGGERSEVLDEEFRDSSVPGVLLVVFAESFPMMAFPDTVKVYITLSNPPPDILV